MPRIELKDLIGTMTLEQTILASWFYSQFDYNIVGINNRHIANVEPFNYGSVIAGSEFLVYAITKLYLYNYIEFSSNSGIQATSFIVNLYDENNVLNYNISDNSIVYDAGVAAIRYLGNNYGTSNGYFSRIVTANYTHIYFNGYRITLD